jgi:hypothetical protein
VVTDWKDANSVAAGTLITAETTNPTYGTVQNNICRWRRVGANAEIEWDYRQSAGGTDGSGIYYFNIPPEIGVIDTTYKPTNSNTTSSTYDEMNSSVGTVNVVSSEGYIFGGAAVVHTSSKVKFHTNYTGGAQGGEIINSAGAAGFGATKLGYTLRFSVPIVGWSSNVQMSSDSDTRVVAAIATGNPASASGGAAIIFPTATYDTHNAYSISTGLYTVPVSGVYQLSGSVNSTAAGGSLMQIYKNGSLYSTVGAVNSNGGGPFSGLVQVNAGDTLSIRCNNTCDADGSSSLNIQRLSGPSQIAASETVAASYYVSTNFAATTTTPINFDTKIFDTHGAVTPSATVWKFTAPTYGIYSISGYWYSASVVYWRVYKNGSYYKNIGGNPSYVSSQFLGHIELNAGDYIDVRPAANATVGGGSLASDTTTSITIARI